MRKRFCPSVLFVSMLVLALTSEAQSDFRVGISMSHVTPLSTFSSANIMDLESGFAESGYSLNFDGDYFIHRRLAVSARFHFGLTSMNKPAVSDWLEYQMTDYLSADSANNLYSVDYWQWSSPMMGIKLNYPIVINKLYVDVAAFSGLSIVKTPVQSMKIIDEVNEQVIFSENIAANHVSVPVMAEAGIRWIASDRIQLKVHAAFFQTGTKREHVSYIVKDKTNEVSEEIGRNTITTPIQTINLGLGLIYYLKQY
ncbi:MAG: hypothetical protein JXR22_10300 [Prolixibacteraceae bacterium]|nr:hypothetical protein [Prolixibacteraceae bacterium]